MSISLHSPLTTLTTLTSCKLTDKQLNVNILPNMYKLEIFLNSFPRNILFYFSGNMKCLECFLISGATIIMPAHTRSADAKRGLVMPLFPQHYIFLHRLLFGFPIFHFGTATSNAIISQTLHIFLLRLLFGFPIFHFGTGTSNAIIIIISPTLHISFQLFTTE